VDEYALPESYAFSVCRMEPENNVHVILEAFSKIDAYPLVMVGQLEQQRVRPCDSPALCHLQASLFARSDLRSGKLKTLRSRASF